MEIRLLSTNKLLIKKLKINNLRFMMFSLLRLWFHQEKENQKILTSDALFIKELLIKFTISKLNKAEHSIIKY